MLARDTRRGGRYIQRQSSGQTPAGLHMAAAHPRLAARTVGANGRGPAWSYAVAPLVEFLTPQEITALVGLRQSAAQ